MWNRRLRDSTVTLAIIAANAVMFGVEMWRDGTENLGILYQLGAMWPPAVLEKGEWWRLGSAAFLHLGWVHIAVNMLSLLAIGSAVEHRLGRWRMLFVFLLGGIGSSAWVLALMHAQVLDEGVLIGASGAIMALFGAMVAQALQTWRASRDVLDRRSVIALSAVLAVQVITDLIIPQVSLAAHLSGFTIGFLVTLLLGARRA